MLSRRTTLGSSDNHSSSGHGHEAISSSPRLSMSGKMMRRVSTIFTSAKAAKKQNSLDTIEASGSRESLESQLSIDEIRRPSGLGRPVSFASTTHSLDLEESIPVPVEYHRFTRAASQPNLAHTLTQKAAKQAGRDKPVPPLPSNAIMVHIPPLKSARSAVTLFPSSPPPVRIPTLPLEVITTILSFHPRGKVCLMAVVSRTFCDAARAVLYGNLDMRNVSSRRYDDIMKMLAGNRHLTDLVHTFTLHRWPPSFALSYPDGDARISMLSQSTATFTIVLQNMHQLTSLTLPAFDLTILRHHTAFGLRNLTFMNRKLSDAEEKELFTWLDGQTNVKDLRFPNLQESNASTSTPSSPVSDDGDRDFLGFLSATSDVPTPSPSPLSTAFTDIPPPTLLYPFNSPTLLPSLTSLHITPALAAVLVPSRPMLHVTLNINSTLYSGLRPATIMASLRGIKSLDLHLGKQVDKRTAEKLLLAASAISDDEDARTITRLSLRVHFAGPGTEDTLHKILTKTLSRFPQLRVLNLSYDPLSMSFEQHRYSMVSILSGDGGDVSPSPSRMSFVSASGQSVAPTQGHGGLLTPVATNGYMTFPLPPSGDSSPTSLYPSASAHDRLTVNEEMRIQMWRKGCPHLQSISMFSGASWNSET